MSFLDDKEQVIDLQLTQHGKRMLREGKFKPYGYSFHDDNIIYDYSYAGVTENQSEIETRILEESIYLEAQANYGGIDTYFKNKLEQSEEDRTYQAVYNMLGNSGLGSQYNPAWNLGVYDATITGSATFITGSGQNVPIPQVTLSDEVLHVDIVYNVDDELLEVLNKLGFQRNDDYLYFEDNTFMAVSDNYILLDVEELNSIFGDSNFEIEVFEVEEDSDTVGSTTKEILTPLSFAQKDEHSNGDIYEEPSLIFKESLEVSPNNVEYYLDIEIDDEIDDNYICQNIESPKRRGIYSSRLKDCKEEGEIINIKDIYGSDIDEEGELC